MFQGRIKIRPAKRRKFITIPQHDLALVCKHLAHQKMIRRIQFSRIMIPVQQEKKEIYAKKADSKCVKKSVMGSCEFWDGLHFYTGPTAPGLIDFLWSLGGMCFLRCATVPFSFILL